METDNRLPVVVYSKKNCQQCNATIRKLDDLGIRYLKRLVDEDEVAADYVKSLGYLQAPVVVVPMDYEGMGGEHFSGYRPDLLAKLV